MGRQELQAAGPKAAGSRPAEGTASWRQLSEAHGDGTAARAGGRDGPQRSNTVATL